MGNSVFIYRGTRNLGDAIQTYAIARLLPGPLLGVYRNANIFAKPQQLIINGWIGSPLKLGNESAIYAGIHLRLGTCSNVEWLEQSIGSIGCRDPHTLEQLKSHGIKSEMVGCATMTLPRYDGPRSGQLRVDGPLVEGCLNSTNKIPKTMAWEKQWHAAKTQLDRLKRAELVYTNRLHVALPCVAFGTPVYLAESCRNDPRFSLWDWLGLDYGKPVTFNLSSQREHYLRWLGKQLGKIIVETDPTMPIAANPTPEIKRRIVVGVLSAQRYEDRRERCRATLAKSNSLVEYLFLVGDPDLGSPELNGDILKLPCPDDYESLPQKVRLFCRWALEQRHFDYLLKCDDDTYLAEDRLLSHDWQNDYIGRSRNGRFAFGGPGYLLSPKAARIVAENLIKPTGHEDVDVGRVLRKQGIKLSECRLFGPRPRLGQLPSPDNQLISVHPVRDDLMQKIDASLNQEHFPGNRERIIDASQPRLEIVSHCWKYSQLLCYQLSSLILYPPSHSVIMTVYYCEEDEETRTVLEFISTHRLSTVKWNWRPLPRTSLFRRAIGRNQAALNTQADWIWFADCDYYFTLGFLDRLFTNLESTQDILVYPCVVQRIAEDVTETLMAEAQRQTMKLQPLPLGESTAQHFTRAIGGIQIVRGDTARMKGYCRDIPKLQRPLKKWKRTVDDVYFRKTLGTSGKPIDIPGLVRIGHAKKGRDDATVNY